MSDNLGTLRKRAELPNALHGCTSNPCGSVVCQTARDRDELLSRLEQAEQHLDAALEANKRWAHRSSRERSELFKAEQAVARVREVADAWKARGEHDMEYSKTIPEAVGEIILEGGAEMVNKANLIYRALAGDQA